MTMGKQLQFHTCLALLLLTCSCGSAQSLQQGDSFSGVWNPQHGQEAEGAPAVDPRLLPAPGLLAARASSFTVDDGHRWGEQFDSALPNNRLAEDGDVLVFGPDFTAGSSGFDGLAYAIYSFTLPDYSGGSASVSFSWNSAPVPGELWIALGDFTGNRWRFLTPGGDGSLQLASLTDYIDESDRLLLAVIAGGTAEAELVEIQISGNALPSAVLISDVDSGPAPLAVNFDASGSSVVGGSITDYEWDIDGDGRFNEEGAELSARGSAVPAEYIYESAGTYVCLVRVASNAGLKSIASLEINAGASASPPTALLTATPDTGFKPLEFSLDASGSTDDGSIADYEWDFDNDGIYNEIPNDENFNRGDPTPPPFLFESAGTFRMRVRVTDDSGDKDTDFVDVTVNGFGPSADLFRRLGEGDAPMDAGLDATDSEDSDGSIVDYEWDFDGDGFFNEPDGEAEWRGNPEPQYRFPKGGAFNATVRVTDDDGLSDTDSELIIVHGWTFVPLDQGVSDGGHFTQVLNVQGKPVVCHSSLAEGRLRFGYSSSSPGTVPEDWTFFDVDATDGPGTGSCLVLVGGQPAIAYANLGGAGGFSYLRASGNGGKSAEDWPAPLRLADGEQGRQLSLAIINGKPAVAYYSAIDESLEYAYSSTADGAVLEDWTHITLLDDADEDIELGLHPSLTLIGSKPAIACGRTAVNTENPGASAYQLLYGTAGTANGALPEDWSFEETFDFLGTNAQSQQHILLPLGLNMPCIAFVARGGMDPGTRGFWFGAGIDIVGDLLWAAELPAPAPGGEIIDPACVVFDDSPQVAYTRTDQQDPFVLRSFVGTAAGTPTWIQATNIREGGDPEGRYMDTMFIGEQYLTLVFRNETLQCPIYAVRD